VFTEQVTLSNFSTSTMGFLDFGVDEEDGDL